MGSVVKINDFFSLSNWDYGQALKESDLIKNLSEQIRPFKPEFHLNQRVNELKKNNELWKVITSDNKIFETPNIIIAGGVGSFEPRKVDIKNVEKFEGKGFYYSVKDKSKFKDQIVAVFGGGDSALDWTLELSNIAKKNKLLLIQDAAQSLGSTYKKKPITYYADCTIFSFQAIKQISSGDGGMLVVKNRSLVKKAKRIRWFGIDRLAKQGGTWENDIKEIGYKYQMTDIGAALLLESIKEFKKINGRDLIGKSMGQFHTDFDSDILKGEITAKRSIFLGKKCYIDELVGSESGDLVDYHIRLKGVPSVSILDYAYNNNITPYEVYEKLFKKDKDF